MARTEPAAYRPSVAVPPGDTFSELLQEHEMSIFEFSELSGIGVEDCLSLIRGRLQIKEDLADTLARVFGLPAHFWMNLDKNYRLTKSRLEQEASDTAEIAFSKQFPLSSMQKSGWIKRSANPLEAAKSLLDFLGVMSPAHFETTTSFSVAFRKSPHKEASKYALAAWLRQGQLAASQIDTATFNPALLQARIVEIRALTLLKPDKFIPLIQDICSDCGVAVVYVPALSKCYVSGAAYKFGETHIVQLSLRYRTNDHFWFNLFHELAHVIFDNDISMLDEKFEYSNDPREVRANDFAGNTLIPKHLYQNWLLNSRFITREAIENFAKQIGIAPGIVLGRLQFDDLLHYDRFPDLKQRYVWPHETGQK